MVIMLKLILSISQKKVISLLLEGLIVMYLYGKVCSVNLKENKLNKKESVNLDIELIINKIKIMTKLIINVVESNIKSSYYN